MVDLKGMSRKKKAEYIWEYYRIHIIGTIAILFIIGSIIHSQVTKIDYVFNLTVIGNIVDESKISNLEKQLTKVVVKEGDGRKQAVVTSIPLEGSSSENTQMSSQYMQKFIAQLSVGELDVVILDKTMLENFAKQDMFVKLDGISQLNLNSLKNEKVEASGSDNKKAVYAINVEDIKMFKEMGIDTRNKVIGIISTSKQKDNATVVLKWMLNVK
ncbi:hypothetical protein K9O30_12405 [Clostridium bowmanii]|uniref:hypothetical protein n=1 Tax=Clostridium bowmanii TaxID=132925 RepID=UPI001C0C6F7B|nr:hypothetical protein [Clostridium bowmanii]MBU3191933.1 hypothetical protein [Clostridium bowmanii]MCA1074510.1 hypothetical protein [Clostridium bowmanii]